MKNFLNFSFTRNKLKNAYQKQIWLWFISANSLVISCICKTKSQFIIVYWWIVYHCEYTHRHCVFRLLDLDLTSPLEQLPNQCAWQCLKWVTGKTIEWSLWPVEFQSHGAILQNKIQPSTFEYLIGFTKCFMNQAALPLAARRALWWILQNGRFP